MTGVSPAVAYRLATTDTTPKLVLTAQCVPWPHSAVVSTHSVYINVKESVKEKGIINPLIVLEWPWVCSKCECDTTMYLVKIGTTRLNVARELEIKKIPVLVIKHEDDYLEFMKQYTTI